ncbi:hypothetical protein BDZ97DRAFT_1798769 [Flammula alnicola]|nr:hypothetical protein BDZ97DRAFT_1798769 [Flammula alnicola]
MTFWGIGLLLRVVESSRSHLFAKQLKIIFACRIVCVHDIGNVVLGVCPPSKHGIGHAGQHYILSRRSKCHHATLKMSFKWRRGEGML